MRTELLQWLRCPECKGVLEAIVDERKENQILEGTLTCRCQRQYPIRNAVPRFASREAYAASFGFEWGMHRTTQLDSANQNGLSEKMFQSRIDFPLSRLQGQRVLDAGCGMGRYAEVAARHGAIVIGVDLSQAIEVAYQNIGFRDNVHLIQADLFHLPFEEETFDFIYSYGVLHHTPCAEKAFGKLPPLLKKGGTLSMFVYDNYNKAIVYSSHFWRTWTTRLPRRLLYYLCAFSIPAYFVYRLPLIGQMLKGIFVISMEKDWRWRWLDTFDWYSPKYQSKHTHAGVSQWFEKNGLSNIKIFEGGVTMLGTKQEAREPSKEKDFTNVWHSRAI